MNGVDQKVREILEPSFIADLGLKGLHEVKLRDSYRDLRLLHTQVRIKVKVLCQSISKVLRQHHIRC